MKSWSPERNHANLHNNEFLCVIVQSGACCLTTPRLWNSLFMGFECLAVLPMTSQWAERQENNGKKNPHSCHVRVHCKFIWTHLFPWSAIKWYSCIVCGRDNHKWGRHKWLTLPISDHLFRKEMGLFVYSLVSLCSGDNWNDILVVETINWKCA